MRLDPAGVTGWNSTGSEATPWAKGSSAEVTLAEPRPGRTARSLWSGFKLLVWGLLTAGSDGWFPDVGAGGDVDLIAVELMVSRCPRIVVAMPNWDEPLSELERYAPQRVMDVLIRTPAARGHLGSPLRLRAVLTDLQARGSAADIDARLLAWAADAG